MAGENLFGKRRGRFDENAAHVADRSLKIAALAAIVAMPADERALFVMAFNRIFKPVCGAPGLEIVTKGA